MTQETTLHIVGTDLLDYSFKVEQAIKEGWTFSDSNELCPRAWPHMFQAFMVKIPKEDELHVKSLADIKNDFINQQQVANTATNVAENTTPKQSTRRNAKK